MPPHAPLVILCAGVVLCLVAWVALDVLLTGMRGVSDEEMQR